MQEDEADVQFQQSAQDHLDLWKNKQEFYSSLLELDLLPADVPGDGNCALGLFAPWRQAASCEQRCQLQPELRGCDRTAMTQSRAI